MNPTALPAGFPQFHDEDWTRQPLGELALKYDTVETHGWYANLEPTVQALAHELREGRVLVDYSGGMGILADRLLKRVGEREIGVIIVDASPKFLRLALEKLREDARVAFRHIRYLKPQARLNYLDEVIEEPLRSRGVDALSSTNAIHLYYDLEGTLRSWTRVLKPGAPCFVQSGNIGNPAAAPDEWIIDATVESIHAAAVELVRSDARWAVFRARGRPKAGGRAGRAAASTSKAWRLRMRSSPRGSSCSRPRWTWSSRGARRSPVAGRTSSPGLRCASRSPASGVTPAP